MSKNIRTIVHCFTCDKELMRSPSRIHNRMFCSRKCRLGVGAVSRPFATCHPDSPHLAKGWCKQCYDTNYESIHRDYRNRNHRVYRQKHPDSVRNSQLKYMYGITKEEFDAKVTKQSNLCAACKTALPTDLDHNHSTGQNRGVLCGDCNRGLGLFKDSPERLRNAADYLVEWQQ